jgi:cell division protein FtsA
MKNKFAAIDVGTTKVCTIIADNSGVAGFRVLGVGISPSQGMHKGIVVNVDEAKESIRDSVRKAEQVAGCKIESACVGVTGRHINSVNTQGAIAITRHDQLVRTDDLKRVLEVAHSVKMPNERKLLHVIPRTYKVDGQEGVKNPVGMHGFRLDVETHVITAAITSIQNLTKCIRSVGVEVEDLILEPLASAEAVLTDEERQDGVMMADIGGGTTDIAVYKDNNIYYTSVLPVAGYQVTRDISIGLGLSFELAEEMKKRYGNLALDTSSTSEVDRTLTEDGHSISYSKLSEIIQIRMEELLRLMIMELPRTEYSKLIPSGLVLTGGGANLPGIAEFAESALRLPVRVGTPMRLDGVSDVLLNPAYATGVGILLWQATGKNKQDLHAVRENTVRRFVSRIFRLFR